jgi:hypothetical protein
MAALLLCMSHGAVCCSVLQCVPVCYSVLQRVAVCSHVLQCVAVCRSVLQRVAACCSVLEDNTFQSVTFLSTLMSKLNEQLDATFIPVYKIFFLLKKKRYS